MRSSILFGLLIVTLLWISPASGQIPPYPFMTIDALVGETTIADRPVTKDGRTIGTYTVSVTAVRAVDLLDLAGFQGNPP